MTTRTANKRAALKKTRTVSTGSVIKPGSNGQIRKTGKVQKTLQDLFADGLKEIYSAEKQLIDALPLMAKAAYHEDLQDAFEFHSQQTKRHAERLEKVFSRLNIEKSDVHTSEAMKGLIEEALNIIDEYEQSAVKDSALIIAAQKIEHLEIALYGSLCELSDVLGYWNIHDILGRSLDEEETTDLNLTEMAVYVNDEACELSEELNEEKEKKSEY